VVSPASHCPNCQKPIVWYDNIPLLSFVLLRAKCRYCAQKISPRYFFVELANGVIWLWLWHLYGASVQFFAAAVLFSILFAVTITDFETGFIPDLLTFPGIAAGLIFSAFSPMLQNESVWFMGLGKSFLGLLVGGGTLLLIGWLGNFIFKKDSMGGGDIKLLAMIGAFIGMQKIILVFLLAPMAAMPFALYTKFFRKAETIPYGPFLALVGAIFFVYGNRITSLILQTYGV